MKRYPLTEVEWVTSVDADGPIQIIKPVPYGKAKGCVADGASTLRLAALIEGAYFAVTPTARI